MGGVMLLVLLMHLEPAGIKCRTQRMDGIPCGMLPQSCLCLCSGGEILRNMEGATGKAMLKLWMDIVQSNSTREISTHSPGGCLSLIPWL